MDFLFEYGSGFMNANLPDYTDVFIPGETVPDPPHIPFDKLEEETQKSILNPLGMEPLSRFAKPGMKVSITFPDRVKGGFQETSHRKTSIPIMIDELTKAGINKKDITLICSNGLHRKNTKNELFNILGAKIFHEFWPYGQIINHDSEDPDNLIDLGKDELGNLVIMNKTVFNSDIPILIGHALGNPYGGYSGGYKHCSTGITNWKSIASHHNTSVMHKEEFVPVSTKNEMRDRFDCIGRHMEKCMGKYFFCCDSVLDTKMNQIAVFSGHADKVQKESWKIADKRTYVQWADKKYDVMIFGMPQAFHYGNGMGTNPILMMQAISANIIRHKRILSDNCVVICSSLCNGYFHDEEFPSYRATYELFQHDYNNILPDIEKFGEFFANNTEYIRKYRFNYAYHPFHAFSMTSCGHIAEMNTSAVYIVGAIEPGYARGMGMKTRATFEEALADAQKKYVGDKPNILVLPKTFTTTAVHLCMKNQ
jgi:hypothetical protein